MLRETSSKNEQAKPEWWFGVVVGSVFPSVARMRKMKNSHIAVGVGIAVALVFLAFVIAFSLLRRPHGERLPVYPDSVAGPGQYWIDSARYVRVSQDGGKTVYLEGMEQVKTRKLGGMLETSIAVEGAVPDVKLLPGWRLGLEDPETIVIEIGDGSVVRRVFGEFAISGRFFETHSLEQNEKHEGMADFFEKEFNKIKENAAGGQMIQDAE